MQQFNKFLTLVTEWALKILMLLGLGSGAITFIFGFLGLLSSGDDDFLPIMLIGLIIIVSAAFSGWAHAMLVQTREINDKLNK